MDINVNWGNYFYHFMGYTGMTLATRCMRHCIGAIPFGNSTARQQEKGKDIYDARQNYCIHDAKTASYAYTCKQNVHACMRNSLVQYNNLGPRNLLKQLAFYSY